MLEMRKPLPNTRTELGFCCCTQQSGLPGSSHDIHSPSVLPWEEDLGCTVLWVLHSTSIGYHWGHCRASQGTPGCSHRITAEEWASHTCFPREQPKGTPQEAPWPVLWKPSVTHRRQAPRSTSLPSLNTPHSAIKSLHLAFVSNAALSLIFFFPDFSV